MIRALLAISLTLLSAPALAEQFVADGPIQVHYSAMTADELTPDIARRLNVTRTNRKALVVIHAQRVAGAERDSRQATVTGRATNLAAQTRKLTFRNVRDGDVDYAIATVTVSNLETLRFDLQVDVANHATPIDVRFSRKFYR